MVVRNMAFTAPIVAGLLIIAIGCPSDRQTVEILLVNTQDNFEVRALRLFDSDDPVSSNLLESDVPPLHSRTISIPFEHTYAADSIGVSFARPGEEVAISYFPDNVENGFAPGERIVFVLVDDGAFDVPPG